MTSDDVFALAEADGSLDGNATQLVVQEIESLNVKLQDRDEDLADHVASASHDCKQLCGEIERLNERVIELQRCNNREVDRRRIAEGTFEHTFEPMRSAHEGYAVILERVDVLWDEVRRRPKVARSHPAMRNAARDVAAACGRFMHEVCDG